MFSRRTNWKLIPNKYTLALQEIRSSGEPLIDLTISNPTECALAYDSKAILNAFQNANALNYEPEAKGLLNARQEVVRYYRDEHNVTVDPNAVILTTSTSEAYSYIFRLLCNPQEEVLVPKPSYPLFDFLGDLQDVRLIPYSLHYAQGWFIDFESLKRALTSKTRAILLVHPNNPTGSYVKPEEVQRLNAFCLENELALIVDEVFLDYSLENRPRISFVGNHDALTFTLSGLSKTAALPQMKVAWMVTTGPTNQTQAALERLEVIADTYLSLGSPTQCAFPQLLVQRKTLQPQLLNRIRNNWACLKSSLRDIRECEPLDVEGGWYAVLRINRKVSDEDLSIELMRQAGVIVHPGHFYDFPNDGYLVVSLISQEQDFRNGIDKLLKHLASAK
jgi:alanine-synthesizing transaminase